MGAFKGFPSQKDRLIPIPDRFFRELLPQINHIGELKLTLYFLWRIDYLEGPFRFLLWEDIVQDRTFLNSLAEKPEESLAILEEAMQLALKRGTILEAILEEGAQPKHLYFLNSPKGRAAVEAIRKGSWKPQKEAQPPIELGSPRPTLYQLYEENIGVITPMIAETLRDMEQTYPYEWIEDALRIAVENNKRNIRYAVAILERWQREGRDARKEKPKDRRGSEEDRRRFVEGEFSEYIEH